MRYLLIAAVTLTTIFIFSFSAEKAPEKSWIRINMLGYKPSGIKVAVWGTKENKTLSSFHLVDAGSKKVVFTSGAGKAYGAYGPFTQTYRLNFSSFNRPGKYYLQAGTVTSSEFRIAEDVYK